MITWAVSEMAKEPALPALGGKSARETQHCWFESSLPNNSVDTGRDLFNAMARERMNQADFLARWAVSHGWSEAQLGEFLSAPVASKGSE